MPDSTTIKIDNDHPVSLSPLGASEVTLKNVGSATIFYKSTPDVSSTRNDGSLTNGQSATFTTLAYLRASSGCAATVTYVPHSAVSIGVAAAATTPGSVTNKIIVYDSAGNTIGFLPVYGAIT